MDFAPSEMASTMSAVSCSEGSARYGGFGGYGGYGGAGGHAGKSFKYQGFSDSGSFYGRAETASDGWSQVSGGQGYIIRGGSGMLSGGTAQGYRSKSARGGGGYYDYDSGSQMSRSKSARGLSSCKMENVLSSHGIPAGCMTGRTAGRNGEMGDHAIDMFSIGHPLYRCARNNLDPRGHHKLQATGLYNVRDQGFRGEQSPRLGVSSGLIGQKAGSRMVGDDSTSVRRGAPNCTSSCHKPALAKEGIPAGCVSGRTAGRDGEMGDYGIDDRSVNCGLHMSVRNNLDPRDSHRAPRPNFRGSTTGGRPRQLGVSSGMIGQLSQSARGTISDPDYHQSCKGKQIELHQNGIPAGCVTGRTAGRSGEMGDYGIDMQAVTSGLHKSARNNVDPRDHHRIPTSNYRASVTGGTPRGKGVSSGLIGERAGARYHGHREESVRHFSPPCRMVPSASSDSGSRCAGMPFSHKRCESAFGVRTIKLN